MAGTGEAEPVGMFRQHEETRRQRRRLNERREALGVGPGPTSAEKGPAAMADAQAKGVAHVLRSRKAVRDVRDVFVTEHTGIAAHESLKRLAERAGDPETAEVAHESRTEEDAMAQRIASDRDGLLTSRWPRTARA